MRQLDQLRNSRDCIRSQDLNRPARFSSPVKFSVFIVEPPACCCLGHDPYRNCVELPDRFDEFTALNPLQEVRQRVCANVLNRFDSLGFVRRLKFRIVNPMGPSTQLSPFVFRLALAFARPCEHRNDYDRRARRGEDQNAPAPVHGAILSHDLNTEH